MNRMELETAINEEGKNRNITVLRCSIYDREKYLEFFLEIENIYADKWVYAHQVEELIHDLAPIERFHKIGSVQLGSRTFYKGDIVELDNIWIRLDAGEEEPKNFIRVGSCCGQYRKGWVTGKVFETPEQNDHALGIKFDRDIYIEDDSAGWVGYVSDLELLIKNGTVKKIEKEQPVWCGTGRWEVRKK